MRSTLARIDQAPTIIQSVFVALPVTGTVWLVLGGFSRDLGLVVVGLIEWTLTVAIFLAYRRHR